MDNGPTFRQTLCLVPRRIQLYTKSSEQDQEIVILLYRRMVEVMHWVEIPRITAVVWFGQTRVTGPEIPGLTYSQAHPTTRRPAGIVEDQR